MLRGCLRVLAVGAAGLLLALSGCGSGAASAKAGRVQSEIALDDASAVDSDAGTKDVGAKKVTRAKPKPGSDPLVEKATADTQAMFDAIKSRGTGEASVTGTEPPTRERSRLKRAAEILIDESTDQPTRAISAKQGSLTEPKVFEAPPEPVPATLTLTSADGATRAVSVAATPEVGGAAAVLTGAAPVVKPLSAPAAAAPAVPRAVAAADSAKGFSVSALAICTRIDGFGRFVAMDTTRLPSGRATPMLIYTELDGFAHRSAAGLPPPGGDGAGTDDGSTEWVVHVGQKIIIYRADEVGTLVRLYEEQLSRDVANRRRRDHYLVQRVTLPATLTPGKYTLKAEVRDLATGAVAERQVPLTIVGR